MRKLFYRLSFCGATNIILDEVHITENKDMIKLTLEKD